MVDTSLGYPWCYIWVLTVAFQCTKCQLPMEKKLWRLAYVQRAILGNGFHDMTELAHDRDKTKKLEANLLSVHGSHI